MRSVGGSFVFLFLALAPAAAQAGLIGDPVRTATPTARPTRRPPTKVRISPQEAQSLVKEMSATVEKIRHLKFKSPVEMKIVDGKAARTHFKSKIAPKDEEQIRYTQEVYSRLGLVPKGTDMLSKFLDLAEEGLEGYYEPGSKVFYLLDHVEKENIRAVMAHELTHALEDQHYDLQAMAKRAEGNDDRATAIASLIEGSAMVVTFVYQDLELRSGKAAFRDAHAAEAERAERLKEAPSFTQRSLVLPYVLGFSFLTRGRPWNFFTRGITMDDLKHAFANPPMSTRQIIHPDLYWRRPDIKFKPPQLPDLSAKLGEGWKKVTEGSIGELGVAVLTGAPINFEDPKILLPSSWSSPSSAGTIGDVYHLYANGPKRLTMLMTGWESERMAKDFAAGWKPVPGRATYRYGASHLILIGSLPNRETADAVASAAFQGATYWPHDEGVGKWPPDHGPELFFD